MSKAEQLLESLNKFIVNENVNETIVQKEQEVKQLIKDKFISIIDAENLSDLRSPEPGTIFQEFRNFFYNVANDFGIIKGYQDQIVKDMEEHPDEEEKIKEWYEPRIAKILTDIDNKIDELL